MTRRPQPAEREVQRAIIDLFAARGYLYERRNVGMAMLPGKDGKPQPVRFGSRGAADIWCLANGVHWEIEVKAPGWKPPTNYFTKSGKVNQKYVHWQEQKSWGEKTIRAGGKWIVATSLDDVIRAGI